MEKALERILAKAEVLIRQTDVNQTIDIFRDLFTVLIGNLTLLKGVKLSDRTVYIQKVTEIIEEIRKKVPSDVNRAEEVTHISIKKMNEMLDRIIFILEESRGIKEQRPFIDKIETAILEYNKFLTKFDQMAQLLNNHFSQKLNALIQQKN